MGAYLSKPETEKISNYETSERLSYAASSMQGWRVSQEDSHNCIIDFDTSDTSFFAVYDGHGGAEVAKYCSMNLPDCLRSTAEYKKGNIGRALEEAFMEFDHCLTKEEVIAELKQIAGLPDSGEDSDDDAAALQEEASLPLDEVLARYETTAVKKLAPHVKNYDMPKSPMLRGKDAEKAGGVNGLATSAQASTLNTKDEPEKSPPVNGEVVVKDIKAEVSIAGNSLPEKEEPKETSEVTVKEKTKKESKKRVLDKKEVIQAGCSGSGDTRKKRASYNVTKESSSGEEDTDDDEYKADSDSSEGEGKGEASNSEEEEEEEEDEEEEDSESDESEEDDIDLVPSNQAGDGEEPGSDSGCTAVVAVMKGNQLFVGNAGDSRCVVCRDGNALNMSNDHKPEDQVERDRIIDAGGQVTSDGRVNGGLNLSRAIGDHAYKNNETLSAREQMITAFPDIQSIVIDPTKDKFMVLACDGIWNSLSSQEVVDKIQERLKEEVELTTICEELLDHCLAPDTCGDGTGCDNMTVIIVKFHNLEGEHHKRPLESNGQSSETEIPAPKKLKLDETTEPN